MTEGRDSDFKNAFPGISNFTVGIQVMTSKEVEKKPPLEAYIDRLLFSDLSKKTVEVILKQLRKLNWKDDYMRDYAIKGKF